ncbi:hypothetical protein B0H11DRAFT_2060302 [Mycena galericulata]|nr:hypothetical protein B0H11DRAFT_2060302 [Mycena galericulata]
MKDFQEQTKFVEERTELVKALREHTKLCEAWSEGNAANRSTELADLKEERFNAIIAKLTDLGWGEELSRILPMDSLKSHKLVKQPQALTERTWNSIKPDMIRYMEEMQTKRFAREHAALLAARKVTATKVLRTFKHSLLPWTDVMPNATSFYDFPAIKAILQAAPEVNVDEWTFESILPDFPEMIATWRAGLLRKLLLLRKNGGLENSDVEDAGSTARLKLATSVYRCLSCDDDDLKASLRRGLRQFELPCRPLYYPRVLSHPCLTLPPDYGQRLLFKENFRDTAWRSHVLAVDKHTAGIVEKVVTACGLDPAKTTAEDMDAADTRLACLACAKRGPPELSLGTDPAGKNDATYRTGEKVQAMVQAYSWRNAVRHDGDIHAMWDDGEIQRQPTAWYMLNEADAAIARALEVVAMRKGSEGTETFAGTMQQSALDSDDAMQDGEDDVAVFLDNSEDEYSVQDGENMETATDCRVRILPSSLPEIAWSCVRCLDRPQEKAPLTFTTVPLDRLQDAAPMTLTATRQHLAARHDVLLAVRDVDYYRVPAAPEVYGPVHFPAPTLTVLGPAIGDEAPVAQ